MQTREDSDISVRPEQGFYSSLFIACVYFFFNSAGLPYGLLYTQLLSPWLYLKLLLKKRGLVLLPFVLLLLPFWIIQLYNGVELTNFLVSNIMLLSAYIFTRAAMEFLRTNPYLRKIFFLLLSINFLFVLLAVVFYFTPYLELFWYKNKFTHSVNELYRLSLLTYEASYYSLMFVPLGLYFLFKLFFNQLNKHRFYILLLILIPLALSLSIGVLAALFVAFIFLYLIHWKRIFLRKSFFYPFILTTIVLVGGFLFLMILFPDNPLFVRVGNIFSGIDTSTNGRTIESLELGYRVAKLKSLWFGAGAGQVKVLAPDLMPVYFPHWGLLETVRIPNAMGETLAIFGIVGVALRLLIIGWLFLRTRVWTNYYRLTLFIFIFIYQFTGSFITNVVEYMAWCLVFINCFPEFDIKSSAFRQMQEKN